MQQSKNTNLYYKQCKKRPRVHVTKYVQDQLCTIIIFQNTLLRSILEHQISLKDYMPGQRGCLQDKFRHVTEMLFCFFRASGKYDNLLYNCINMSVNNIHNMIVMQVLMIQADINILLTLYNHRLNKVADLNWMYPYTLQQLQWEGGAIAPHCTSGTNKDWTGKYACAPKCLQQV